MTSPLPRLTLVLGGARAGKSRFAERLMNARPGPHAVIATGTAGDAEMAARIARHRAERNPAWETIEEPLALAAAIGAAARPERIVLIDCLTLWISNIMHAERDMDGDIAGLAAALAAAAGPVIVVANEVGLGIVPDNALARAYRDHLGRANQAVAAVADCALFMAAGLPLALKGTLPA